MDAMIIFTDDNTFAYQIGRQFLLPVITHKTKAAERKQMLQAFREGELRVLVTSKVLNEGVDVPAASIGVVMSGSGAVREHVQRLGRILRRLPGKRAILYELIAQNTNEQYVNIRRKQHNAYQRTP
jgi:superfamily II DNA or RNA helicase